MENSNKTSLDNQYNWNDEQWKAQVSDYIKATLGQRVTITAWEKAARLPLNLQGSFSYYVMTIMDTQILLLHSKVASLTPVVIEKRMNALKSYWPDCMCVVFDHIISYTRSRLVEKRIQFIVPGNQLYLPCLGLDLREYYKAPKQARAYFSPAAQALLIYVLEKKVRTLTNEKAAIILSQTSMTAVRALREVAEAGLCARTKIGAKASYDFYEVQSVLWEQAYPHLRNPIKKTVYVDGIPDDAPIFRAGLSALAEYSMIAPDNTATWAVSQANFKEMVESGQMKTLPYKEPFGCTVEIWRYDPAICARGGAVDPRSLYLSLKDMDDERVLGELERMQEVW